jgi:sulfhydrogenase subunit alpha
MADRVIEVPLLTRVEGEGRLRLVVEGGRVQQAELSIFEAPRYFEALLRGRDAAEVPDIVARICGICPVAYQLSALAAIESAWDCEPGPEVGALRRLLYCGEWVQSHALHVFLLHAPDYLGFPSAAEMAATYRERVEQGLRLKKAGARLMEVVGGRAIHPVTPVVGGFSRTPDLAEVQALRPLLAAALDDAVDATAWAAGLPTPELDAPPVWVALGGERYPMVAAREVWISGRAPVALEDWESAFVESQVQRSNALYCHLLDGTPYLCGPLARLAHHAERLHPVAARALQATGLALPLTNPYRSIVARCVELVHALADALDLVDAYRPLTAGPAPARSRDAVGFGATEAPRGLLWHRFELGADGRVRSARIVPPTSQNQARIEQDLVALGPELLPLDLPAATLRCEQLVRAYDPCISCATHFLQLTIEGR